MKKLSKEETNEIIKRLSNIDHHTTRAIEELEVTLLSTETAALLVRAIKHELNIEEKDRLLNYLCWYTIFLMKKRDINIIRNCIGFNSEEATKTIEDAFVRLIGIEEELKDYEVE